MAYFTDFCKGDLESSFLLDNFSFFYNLQHKLSGCTLLGKRTSEFSTTDIFVTTDDKIVELQNEKAVKLTNIDIQLLELLV